MTRKECFDILGLPSTANASEIRRRYKKLALQFHPDVNPDPKAHDKFLLLVKATEILLDPNYKETTIHHTQRPSRNARNETPEERKQRMQAAQERYKEQKKRKHLADYTYFLSLTTGRRWFAYRLIMVVGLILACIMTLEYFLPSHYETDELIGYAKLTNNGIRFNQITPIKLSNRGVYYAESNPYAWLYTYPEVIIETSWFLHTPKKMLTTDDFKRYPTSFDFHLESLKFILIPLFLLSVVPYLQRKNSLAFVFLYHLTFWGNGMIILYLLLTENRLQHLLTLGFF